MVNVTRNWLNNFSSWNNSESQFSMKSVEIQMKRGRKSNQFWLFGWIQIANIYGTFRIDDCANEVARFAATHFWNIIMSIYRIKVPLVPFLPRTVIENVINDRSEISFLCGCCIDFMMNSSNRRWIQGCQRWGDEVAKSATQNEWCFPGHFVLREKRIFAFTTDPTTATSHRCSFCFIEKCHSLRND